MAGAARKRDLIAALERSRSQLAANASALGHDLNLAAKAKKSFRQHRGIWLGGAALLGVVLTRRSGGKKKVVVKKRGSTAEAKQEAQGALKAGVLFTVAKLAFGVFRPALTAWLTQRVADYAANGGRFRRDSREA
jgi:hypothetical protein